MIFTQDLTAVTSSSNPRASTRLDVADAFAIAHPRVISNAPTLTPAPTTGLTNGVSSHLNALNPDHALNPDDALAIIPEAARNCWMLDPAVTFLNHGSYGAMPRSTAALQSRLRDRMEREPIRFFKHDLEGLVDAARTSLAGILNCRPNDLAPISNATHALNTILANTPLRAGDEILISDHEYQSLLNELDRVCQRTGATVVEAKVPFPIVSAEVIVENFLAAITPRTRIVFISHITSASSLIFPVALIIKECNARGIDVVLDGAHSPGQIPVDLAALSPSYFVGSGHKWLCGPKGIGFLFVRADKQPGFRPLALSSRANKVRPERSLFLRDFDYSGTGDYSAFLALPESIAVVGSLLPGSWPALFRHNHALALKARDIICNTLGIASSCPDSMVGTMISIPIPDAPESLDSRPSKYDDALQDILIETHGFATPVWRLNCNEQRIVRVSAQVYNTLDQYQRYANVLKAELAKEASAH